MLPVQRKRPGFVKVHLGSAHQETPVCASERASQTRTVPVCAACQERCERTGAAFLRALLCGARPAAGTVGVVDEVGVPWLGLSCSASVTSGIGTSCPGLPTMHSAAVLPTTC